MDELDMYKIADKMKAATLPELATLLNIIEEQTGAAIVVLSPFKDSKLTAFDPRDNRAPAPPRRRVELRDNGHKRIAVIKTIRRHTGLGLREAKEMSEQLPTRFPSAVSTPEFATELRECGATVEWVL